MKGFKVGMNIHHNAQKEDIEIKIRILSLYIWNSKPSYRI